MRPLVPWRFGSAQELPKICSSDSAAGIAETGKCMEKALFVAVALRSDYEYDDSRSIGKYSWFKGQERR